MAASDLAASLRRRQYAREKMKRYWHTRSFIRLAGRYPAPDSERKEPHTRLARMILLIVFLALFGVGLFFSVKSYF